MADQCAVWAEVWAQWVWDPWVQWVVSNKAKVDASRDEDDSRAKALKEVHHKKALKGVPKVALKVVLENPALSRSLKSISSFL